MSLIETCLLIVAVSAAAVAVATLVALGRLLKLWASTNLLLGDLREVIGRLNTIAAELEQTTIATRDVRRRVTQTANRILDEVEPPVRQITAILSGIRVGLGALFGSSTNGSQGHSESATRAEAPFDRTTPSERKQP